MASWRPGDEERRRQSRRGGSLRRLRIAARIASFALAVVPVVTVLAPGVGWANDLPTGSWAGGRPPECNPAGRANAWERAKEVASGEYCRRLAEGAELLAGSGWVAKPEAERALAAGEEAEKLYPAHAAAAVLRARAYVALRQPAPAQQALDTARALDPRSLDDVASLLAAARTSALAGRMDEARGEYAQLLPRASSLPLAARGPVFFEAGMASMALGPSGIEEAVARFRELVRGSQEEMQTTAVAALALALDRQGGSGGDAVDHGGEASALLAERGPFRVEAAIDDRVRASLRALHAEAEENALLAILESAAHPDRARTRWRAYLTAAASGAPPEWLEGARRHLGERPAPRLPAPPSARTRSGKSP